MSIAYKLLAGVLLLIGAFSGGFYAGHHAEDQVRQAQLATLQGDDARALAKAEAKALQQQQQAEQRYAAAQATYEKETSDAKATYDSNVAALRAGTLRLRNQWSCTSSLAASVQHAAASGPSPDAAADLRYQSASDLVRNADAADTQIRALQAIVRADHQQ